MPPPEVAASPRALLDFLLTHVVASRRGVQPKVRRETDSRVINVFYFCRCSSRGSIFPLQRICIYILYYIIYICLILLQKPRRVSTVVDEKRTTLPHDSLDGFCSLLFSGPSLAGRRGSPVRRQGIRGTQQPGISPQPNVLPESARVGSPDV